jgi:CBS domain-containing protein
MSKAKDVSVVMTDQPVVLGAQSLLTDAAGAMRDSDIGDVIVVEGGSVYGIVTDRDIVVRGIATGKDPSTTRLDEICSKELATVSPDTGVDDAVRIMREKAIRRLPVIEGGKPVGVVSIGDLAVERDPTSALADISEAPANT